MILDEVVDEIVPGSGGGGGGGMPGVGGGASPRSGVKRQAPSEPSGIPLSKRVRKGEFAYVFQIPKKLANLIFQALFPKTLCSGGRPRARLRDQPVSPRSSHKTHLLKLTRCNCLLKSANS